MQNSANYFMQEAIKLAQYSLENGGGPFGAVIVKNNEIIATGHNQVTINNDPTAHAEVVAIRNACKRLNTFDLSGYQIYTSCEPCPMCFGAIYWARLDTVYYAATADDAAAIGFDDRFIYDELSLPVGQRKVIFEQILQDEACTVFKNWQSKIDKLIY